MDIAQEDRPSPWKRKLWKIVIRRLPIIKHLQNYTKVNLVSDFIAGITIALTMIPQSIAYAALAGLKPQFGLNSTFVGCFLYAIFGTVKEVSIGPTSLMSLLTFEFTRELNPDFVLYLTLISGVVEFLMGLLKLGFLINFISAPVTSGFTSATSIIVLVSQLKGILGVRFKSCGFIDNIKELFNHALETKISGDFALGVFCIIFLLLLRKLKDVRIKADTPQKRFYKKALWFILIGRNAILVFMCSCIALSFELSHKKAPFILSGSGESGIPSFKPPPTSTSIGNETYNAFEMAEELGSAVFIVPIVAVLANIAIAKAFSTGEKVDATQEMLTLSLCNIVGSFFGSMPTCGAFTRSAVSSASGVRSPVAGFFSGCLCLLALNFLSPYFHLIPRATLSAILICAVVFLFDWQIIVPLWRTNKYELFILLLTLLTCLCFGVEIGLLIGVTINLAKLLYVWAEPNIYKEIKKGSKGDYVQLTPDKGLFFPGTDKLHSKIVQLKQDGKTASFPIVVDCIHFSSFDYTAVKAIVTLANQSVQNDWELIFLNIKPDFVAACLKISNTRIVHCDGYEELESILPGKIIKNLKSVTISMPKENEDKCLNKSVLSCRELIPLIDKTKNNNMNNSN